MNSKLSLISIGHASSIFLLITFCLCVGFDLLFPGHAMFRVWQDLLPGFVWISWKSFFIGLVWSYIYGWYFAVIWVPLYNYFNGKHIIKES
jgi:hypothetical protein